MLEKLRMFSTGSFRPKKVDMSYTFRIPIFPQKNNRLYLIFKTSCCSISITVLYMCSVCLSVKHCSVTIAKKISSKYDD